MFCVSAYLRQIRMRQETLRPVEAATGALILIAKGCSFDWAMRSAPVKRCLSSIQTIQAEQWPVNIPNVILMAI